MIAFAKGPDARPREPRRSNMQHWLGTICQMGLQNGASILTSKPVVLHATQALLLKDKRAARNPIQEIFWIRRDLSRKQAADSPSDLPAEDTDEDIDDIWDEESAISTPDSGSRRKCPSFKVAKNIQVCKG